MEAYKKVTSHGSISIPVAMRRDLGIEPKDPMSVHNEGNRIVITPYQPHCIFCHTIDQVRLFRGKAVCADCGKEIVNLMEEK